MTKFLFLLVCAFILNPNNNLLAKTNNDNYIEMSKNFSNMNDTYGVTTDELKKYLENINLIIKNNPDNPAAYLIRSDLVLITVGHEYRKSKKINGSSSNDYLSKDETRKVMLEIENCLKNVLSVNKNAPAEIKLDFTLLQNLHIKFKSLRYKEKSIKSYISSTSLENLKGCPATNGYDGCPNIANSWTEFLYNEYSGMYNLYGLFLDKVNMERIKKEFKNRIINNEMNIKNTKKLTPII